MHPLILVAAALDLRVSRTRTDFTKIVTARIVVLQAGSTKIFALDVFCAADGESKMRSAHDKSQRHEYDVPLTHLHLSGNQHEHVSERCQQYH